MTDHPQVRLLHPDGGIVEVDEGLADLLVALWALGIETSLSCQANRPSGQDRDWVWIQFVTAEDAEQFLCFTAPAQDADDNSLYQRITHRYGSPDAWRIDARVVDDLEEGDWKPADEDDPEGPGWVEVTSYGDPALYRIAVSVRFPPADLPHVTARIQAAAGRSVARTDRRQEGL